MKNLKPASPNQPQVDPTTVIYGSSPVEPLHGASNQPPVLPHTRVRGQRITAAVRVKLTDGGQEMIIAESDFDPDRYERLDDA